MITTSFYLDSRRSTTADDPAPLKLAINWRRTRALLPTGIRIKPSAWDDRSSTAKDKAIQLLVSGFKYKVDTLISNMLDAGKLDGLQASGIKRLLVRELSPESTAPARFLAVLEDFARSRNKPRTREIYLATADRIRAFDRHADNLGFSDLNVGWLDRFDSFLAKTSPKKNARNIHFRNIRAVFNDARRKEITTCYPFLNYAIHPEPTRHKALPVEQLRTLFNAEVAPWQQKYLDFFKISFMLIGINTEDLLHATVIDGDRLSYTRAKTNKPYSIKVEPECMELIRKYRGKKYLLNIMDTYARTAHWTSKVNNELKKICEPLGLPPISMYWARHSWITMATNLDIPDRTVSAAAGHSSHSVTEIYIDFDRAKIDRANRKVLDYVLYDKKESDMFEMLRQIQSKISMMA